MTSRGTVLIVDDEIGPRESLKMILKPFHTIETAENGVQALEILGEKEIDLVTLDLKMPGPDGAEVLKEIKQNYPDTEVLIITGYGSLKSAIDGIRHGACDYLLKPFNISEIVMIINKALNKRNKAKEVKTLLNAIGNTVEKETKAEDLRDHFKGQDEAPRQISPASI